MAKKDLLIILLSLVVAACALKQPEDDEKVVTTPVPERLQEAATALNNNDLTGAQSLYQEVIEELVVNEITATDKKASKKGKQEVMSEEERLDYLSTAYTGLGVIAQQASNFPVAREMFRGALEANPENIAAQEGVALITLNEGKKLQAKKMLLEVMDKTAGEPRWRTLNALGVVADFEGKYDEAVTFYQRSIEAGGPEEQAMNNQGYSQLMAGNYDDALAIFTEAQARYPASERINANMALTLARAGRYEEARKTWAKTLKAEEAWNNAGYVAMMNGDLKLAREYLETAIEVAPRYYEAAETSLEHLKQLESKK